ncbi:hypothetical protein AAG906_030681 [Vitis piasezkii]
MCCSQGAYRAPAWHNALPRYACIPRTLAFCLWELICIKGLDEDFFPKALILERQGKRTEVGKLGEE